MTQYYHKIGSADRIAIPKKFMKKYGLKIGDIVILEDAHPEGFIVIPAKVVPKTVMPGKVVTFNESFVEDNQHTNSEPHT